MVEFVIRITTHIEEPIQYDREVSLILSDEEMHKIMDGLTLQGPARPHADRDTGRIGLDNAFDVLLENFLGKMIGRDRREELELASEVERALIVSDPTFVVGRDYDQVKAGVRARLVDGV